MANISSNLPSIARVVLGLVFFVFGLNGFLHFLPQPPMSGPPAQFRRRLVRNRLHVPAHQRNRGRGGLAAHLRTATFRWRSPSWRPCW